jgi:hypothetical protein
LISVKADNRTDAEAFFKKKDLPFAYLGRIGGKKLRINTEIDIPISRLSEIYFETIGKIME